MRGILLTVLIFGFAAYTMLWLRGQSTRNELLVEYSSVESLTLDPIQISCTRFRGRSKYDFVAKRSDGTRVHGYICAGPFGSVIHEQ